MATPGLHTSFVGQRDNGVSQPFLASTPARSRQRPPAQRCSSAVLTEARPSTAAHTEVLPRAPAQGPSSQNTRQRAPKSAYPRNYDDAWVLLESLQQEVHARGTATGLNVVALSGGSSSALVAYLLASVFEDSTVACIGVSPSLPEAQLQRARYTADALGLELWELDVRAAPQPQAARGMSFPNACPRSERSLFLAVAAILAGANAAAAQHAQGTEAAVFCGANAADVGNATRAGLTAAAALPGVVSPLAQLPPAAVTALAQLVGLPDWGHAEVAYSKPRWPMTRHAVPKLARLARSLSKGQRSWSMG